VTATDATWALFDLDGCLIDSSEAIPACLNAALVELDLPPYEPADLQWCIGPPLAGSIERLVAMGGLEPTPTRVATGLATYREVFPDLAGRLTTVIDGVDDLLAALPQRRAVVTSKPAGAARPLVDAMGLGWAFEVVHGPGLDVEHEPKAVTLGRALDDLGIVDPATAVMIGDRHHDVDAGRERGTATVGVTWGAGDRAELTAAGADHVVDHPDELLALLTA